jgi:hypothetical protein
LSKFTWSISLWKQDKKLSKRYVGKSRDDFRLRQIAKEIKLKPSLLIKFKFIEQQASKGNVLAKQYLEKLRTEEVSIDWAHRVLTVIPEWMKTNRARTSMILELES